MTCLKKQSMILLTMIKHGVLAVESKSGYGLDRENELKQLKVSNRLAEKYDLDIKHTFLGPHAVPKEASSNEGIRRNDCVTSGSKTICRLCGYFL